MSRYTLATLFLLLAACVPLRADAPPALFPQPKDVKFTSQAPVKLESGRVAIVIGANATEPEEYAAETLRKHVSKRFAQDWPVVRDGADLKAFKVLVLLGQQSSNKLLDAACRGMRINPSEKFPIPDGYALGVGKNVAVVAGSNPRSVIFGQDTLFQLIQRQGGSVVLVPAMIRDWPSMPHRGKVSTGMDFFLEPGVLDAVALGRLNFIDLRNGTYGTPPGATLNHDSIKKIVKEAHRRGLVVYGTVSLAVQKPEFDKCIATFQEFIDQGVDGLWPYLGDPGGEGRSGTPLDLLQRVVELGKKHGMTGDLIHYTPGKMGYKTIATNDNFAAAKVPGMADALWFFAVKPTPQSCADAARLGLRKKYIWWNHWPHPRGGFTSCGNPSMRADGKSNIYADLTPFQDAYQEPTPQELAKVPEYADGSIFWGGTIWLQETVASVFGWWAWSPETHDWQQNRRRIYDYLYGPELVSTAFEFNNMLAEVKSKFYLCGDEHIGDGYTWPPLLRDLSTRSQCREILDKMAVPLQKLQQGAANGSMFSAETMEKFIFEPARAELAAGKVIIDLPRAEYWWNASRDRILMAVREGDTAQALRWQAEAKERLQQDKAKCDQMLSGIVQSGGFESFMEAFDKRAGDAVYTSARISIDGILDEPAWATAPKLGPFRIYNDQTDFETPSNAQVLYGDDALYVGLTFGEPRMDLLTALRTRHDSDVWEDDAFEIFVNTDGLGKPYYHFICNTLGATYESFLPADGDEDSSWNGQWEVKVSRKSDGWSAEVRIPYTTIGATKPERDAIWLLNFARNDTASDERATRGVNYHEQSAWGYSPRGQLHDTRKFRPLRFE